MVGQRTPYCENFEHPCDNEHDVVNAKTGLCPNKKRAKCMPLQHFACETYVLFERTCRSMASLTRITREASRKSTLEHHARIQVRKRDQGICTDFEKTKTIEQSVGH